MASEPARPADGERGLHAFSWLFVLLTQLRHGVLPLLVLLVFGQGEWWELMVLVGAAALAIYSLIYSFGFRYRLGADEMVVREGIIDRTERHIPYARIQNIVQRRNPLHRLFRVTELRLESAGGSKPEAVMNVITLADAARIEQVLRAHAPTSSAADHADTGTETGERRLLSLELGELLRLGLISNRGWAIVGAAFALLWQLQPDESSLMRTVWRAVARAIGDGAALIPGPFATVIAALAMLVAFALTLKLLSMAMAVLSFHRFRLGLRGERVRSEAGLLTRAVASARRDKIQRVIFAESWLARRLDRRSLTCEVAGGVVAVNEDDGTRLHWLAPIARPDVTERIAAELVPGLLPSTQLWRPLHPRAWRRMFNAAAFVWTAIALPLLAAFGPWITVGWVVLMVWTLLEARGAARFGAYAFDGEIFAVRGGWLTRHWTLVRIGHGQSVRLSSNPLDRRAGMASVSVDTAGMRPASFPLRVDYLGEVEARELHYALSRALDRA